MKRAAPDGVQAMKLAVMGGAFHMASADANPNHKYCPKEKDSWCDHNRAIAEDPLVKFQHKKA